MYIDTLLKINAILLLLRGVLRLTAPSHALKKIKNLNLNKIENETDLHLQVKQLNKVNKTERRH